MVIFFDTRHLGQSLYQARHATKIAKADLALLLGITPGMLNKYEHGHDVIPIEILTKLFTSGIIMLRK